MSLSEYLKKFHLIQSKFGEKCGIKKSAFCRYVNGSRRPPYDIALRIKKESKGMITEFDDIIS